MSQINWHEILTSTMSVRTDGSHWTPCILGQPVPGTEEMRLTNREAQRFGEGVVSFLADILALVTTQLLEHLGDTVVSKALGNDTAGVISAIRKDPWDAVSLVALADMIEEKRGETVEAERIRTMIANKRSILVLEATKGTDIQQHIRACEAIKTVADKHQCDWIVIPHGWKAYVVNPKENNP